MREGDRTSRQRPDSRSALAITRDTLATTSFKHLRPLRTSVSSRQPIDVSLALPPPLLAPSPRPIETSLLEPPLDPRRPDIEMSDESPSVSAAAGAATAATTCARAAAAACRAAVACGGSPRQEPPAAALPPRALASSRRAPRSAMNSSLA